MKAQKKRRSTIQFVTDDGVVLPYPEFVPYVSATARARASRRKRYPSAHSTTVKKAKGMYFPRHAWNEIMAGLRAKERKDPRGYIYGYEHVLEELRRKS